MSELLAILLRWIWDKFVLLILVVLVLLVAHWFRSEWRGISLQLKQASVLDGRIDSVRKDLVDLRKQSAELGEDARQQMEALHSAEQATAVLWSEAGKAQARYQAASRQVGWYQKWFDQEMVVRKAEAWAAYQARKAAAEAAQKTTDALVAAERNSLWADHRKKIESNEIEIERLEKEREEILSSAGKTPSQRLAMSIRNVLPAALWVLVGIVLAPMFIKALLYFGVAPLIARARPVVVLPCSGADLVVSSSHVSLPIFLDPGDELIVHSDYLQASGAGPGKTTRWLFSWRMPLTSVAAGLYAMVAVRNRDQEPGKVTVSPKKNLFDKVCDVRIPAGSAMVIYPRALVGIIMKNGVTPRITRHWHVRSLHGWLTFQFRYLVLHGESRILMKGCRGVRAERVETTKPVMQDQSATLGFTANLAYSAIRCETFADYLLGRDQLFNDRFSDADGFQFTEEVPNPNRKTGLFGRGLEGIMDGFLKAFGI
jgi:hypothetical protein